MLRRAFSSTLLTVALFCAIVVAVTVLTPTNALADKTYTIKVRVWDPQEEEWHLGNDYNVKFIFGAESFVVLTNQAGEATYEREGDDWEEWAALWLLPLTFEIHPGPERGGGGANPGVPLEADYGYMFWVEPVDNR